MPKRKKKPSFYSRYSFLIAVVVLLALVVAAWLWHTHSQNESKASTTSSGAYVNLSPPTNQDKQDNNQRKANLGNQPSPPPVGSNGKTLVVPVITSTSANNIKAFVQGIVEDGGTCTATITQGSNIITETSSAIGNASTTNCQTINISPALSNGSWSVKVTYSSSDAEGTSQAQTFEVQ